jgi:hypothetical protein
MRRPPLPTSIRSRPLLFGALALALPLALAATCATTSRPNAGKYPPRAAGCKIRVFHGPPDVKEWDDLGVAHVDCYLDLGRVQCLHKLKMEACRLGGDLLYDVPNKPLRPTEQGMLYTGHVAHTKAPPDAGGAGQDQDDVPDAASEPTSEARGPVEPIAPVAPPADGSRPSAPSSQRDGGPG